MKTVVIDKENAKLHISKGNSKLGKTINFSMLPGRDNMTNQPGTCVGVCEGVCGSECYAIKSMNLHNNVVPQAWGENTFLALNKPDELFSQFAEELQREYNKEVKRAKKQNRKPKKIRVRLNQAGEIPTYNFLKRLIDFVESCENIAVFYIYTKRYQFVNSYIFKRALATGETPKRSNNWLLPKNFCVRFSEWNGTAINPYNLPVFEFVDKDFERPEGLYCPAVKDNGKGRKGSKTKTTCEQCGLCANSKVPHIFVIEH